MKVLVTGNKGYIGAVLYRKLIDEGFEVVGLDTGFYEGCNFFAEEYKTRQIKKDIRNINKEDLFGIDAIVHLAALSNDPIGEINRELTSKINFFASVNLAKLAKECNVKRFIFSSSCSVYGVVGDEMIDENGIVSPATEYARSKLEAEKEISRLADKDFSPVFLRNSTVYGVSPMLRVDLVVNNLVGWAYTTGKIRVMSDGSPWRPLIHIQDICKAFIAALKTPQDLIHNRVFNVGQNNENYRIRDIVDMIKRIMPQCNIEYTGEHGSDTRSYRVDFTKFREIMGNYFNPDWNIEKGIKELFEAYRANNLSENDFQGEKFIRLKKIKNLIDEGRVDEKLFWKKGEKQ